MNIRVLKENLDNSIVELRLMPLYVSSVNELLEAFNTAKLDYKKIYNITITLDLYLLESINIENSLANVVINGQKHYIYGGVPVSFNYSNGIASLLTDIIPRVIIVDGIPRMILTSCDYHYNDNLYLISGNGTYTCLSVDKTTFEPLETQTNKNCYYRLNRPENFPNLVENNGKFDEWLYIIDKWMTHPAEIIKLTNDYIYIDPKNLNTYLITDKNNIRARLINGKLENERFIVKHNDLGFQLLYKCEQSPSQIIVCSVTNLMTISRCANLTISNCKFVGTYRDSSDEKHRQADYRAPSSIIVNESALIKIIDNEFKANSGYCIKIGSGCTRCYINNNYIHDTLGGGIHISKDLTTSNRTSYIQVKNNLIKGIGRFVADAVGILVRWADNIDIEYNTICDTFYTGISLNWTWGWGTSYSYSNYVGHNHIHHCLQFILSDGGGIYSMGKLPNTLIECNVIHDIYAWSTEANGGFCIYNENGASDFLVRYNKLYSANGIVGFGTLNNVYVNNILAYPTTLSVLYSHSSSNPSMSLIVIKNLIKSDKDNIVDKAWVEHQNLTTLNIVDNFLLPIRKAMFNNFAYRIPFKDPKNGDFKITEDFTVGKLTVKNATDSSTIISYSTLNNMLYGILTYFKEYSNLTDTFYYNGEEMSYDSYYKKYAIDFYNITNEYLNNY